MKSNKQCNFAIILLLTILNCFLSRGGLHMVPMEEIENEDFNPFNPFLNFDKIANEMMCKDSNISIKIILFFDSAFFSLKF